jgi:hypothetical protein
MGTALVPTKPRVPATGSPFSDVPEAQDYLRESVQGYGEQLQPAILKDIGTTLGSLNEAGGLRSGGVTVALGDVGQKYASMIGAYAKQASGAGLEAGLEARKQRFAEEEARRARKHSLLKAIGSVLGAGVGFIAAGPARAAATTIGEQAGI